MSFELQDITEGNWHFTRKVIKKASVDAMTLTRGVTFFDSDFWRWMIAAITGDPQGFQSRSPAFSAISIGGPTPRRTLILIQFFARNPISTSLTSSAATALVAANAGFITANIPGNLGKAIVGTLAAGGAGAGLVGKIGRGAAFGPFEFAVRMPAKAWILHDCLPTRYKAGGDFDARTSDISIMELEIQPEMIEELSLTA